MRRNFRHALLSVLAGNAVYFALLMPRLPASLQHAPDRPDAGLGLDFLICAGLYILIRLFGRGNRDRRGGIPKC